MRTKQNRVIVDTSLWISYLISNGYRQLDELIFSDKIQLIFSEELIEEFINVTKRPKFKKYFSSEDILKLLELFNTFGKLVTVTSDIDACRDEKDNFLLSLAADSHADFLITGDADLLELKSFRKSKILTIDEFDSLFKQNDQ